MVPLPFQILSIKVYNSMSLINLNRECLQENIRHNTEPVIMCPYQDGDYSCPEVIIEREIKAVGVFCFLLINGFGYFF